MNLLQKLTIAMRDDGELDVSGSTDLSVLVRVIEDIGGFEDLWSGVLDAIDGKGDLPFWTGGDEGEVRVDGDGVWFGMQSDPGVGIRVAPSDARPLVSYVLQLIQESESE
ncbi:hypothetical protein AB0H12_08725 [Actinosynnema sp. NPDC023794]